MRNSTQMEMMWMGTPGRERWVPAPSQDANFSRVGYSTSKGYLNGGAGKRLSKAGHKEYQMAWGHKNRDDLRFIADLKAGVHGDDLIYFIDPMAADYNVLPMQWAFPAQAYYDAPPLYGAVRPGVAQTSGNTNDYPLESAVYTYQAGGLTKTIYIPIPDGYAAWVGIHGSISGAGGVYVQEVGGTSGYATLLDVTDVNRVSDQHSNVQGINLSVRVESGSLTLSGMMVQILPIGVVPFTGNFISGQGHSGCMFDDDPEQDMHSSWYDSISMSATLIEVGDWL